MPLVTNLCFLLQHTKKWAATGFLGNDLFSEHQMLVSWPMANVGKVFNKNEQEMQGYLISFP